MKYVIAVLTVICFSCNHQPDKIHPDTLPKHIPVSVKDSMILSIDKSPMDMIYFPEDYPQQKSDTPDKTSPVARVIYSRPQKNGRVIFADSSVNTNVIQHYGQAWRLGANEATEIEFFKAVTINEKKMNPGRYVMYCIPYADTWKIIFNSNLHSWGLHIDRTKDITEIELPLQKNDVDIEYFTMRFQNAAYGCNLVMAWDKMKVVMPVSF